MVKRWATVLLLLGIVLASAGTIYAQSGESTVTTSACTGSPCPWGNGPYSDNDLVWPSSVGATNTFLGYTYSQNVYAPAAAVNGATVTISGGASTVFYAATDTDNRVLTTINGSGSYTVAIDPDEKLLVEGSGWFAYTLTNLPSAATATSTPTSTAVPGTATSTSTPTLAPGTPTATRTATPIAQSSIVITSTVTANFDDLMTTTLPALIAAETDMWEPTSRYGYLYLSLAGFFLFVFFAMFIRSIPWRSDD